MPTKTAKKNAAKAKKSGKSPSTQAGAYVREEMHAMKRGSKRIKSRKQAIAVGLSEARQAGIKVGKRKSVPKKNKSAQSTKTTSQRSATRRRNQTSISQPAEHETPLASLELHMKSQEPMRELGVSVAQENRRKNLAKKKTYTGKEHSLSHSRSHSSQYRG